MHHVINAPHYLQHSHLYRSKKRIRNPRQYFRLYGPRMTGGGKGKRDRFLSGFERSKKMEIAEGTVFQFNSFGMIFTALCIGFQNREIKCFRVVDSHKSCNTVGMHSRDGRLIGADYRIAYKSKFLIHASQVKKYLFTCMAEDVAWAERMYQCLTPICTVKAELKKAKRVINKVPNDERARLLKEIRKWGDELYERGMCVFERAFKKAHRRFL